MSTLLAGRRIAITGASRGIGRAIAQQLLDDGASVALSARDRDTLTTAADEMRSRYGSDRVVEAAADVIDIDALDAFALLAESRFGTVDGLVCNAGIWGPKGTLERISWDDWMYAFEVNVHGVARTLRAFLPALRRATGARVVILSGGGATKPMANLAAYSATKSAVVRLGETVAQELLQDGIAVNMLAPGAVNTSMLDELLAAGPERIGMRQYEDARRQHESGGTPPERGASCCAFLLSAQAEGITGKLVSAVWDPWESLSAHRDELLGSDVYTLRRIVPSERGMHW